MAKINVKTKTAVLARPVTHEGAPAKRITKEQELRRTVMATFLWEDSFYENGEDVAKRIQTLVHQLSGAKVQKIAIEARDVMKLRHVPLLLARELARHPKKAEREYVADTLAHVIQRPDELAEYVAIYWKDGKEPLSAQSKKGLARAFTKFNEYQLAKYNRDGAVKLRDVLFLSHAKPEGRAQKALFKKVVNNTLKTPDTWEVALSGGADKKETFTRLIQEENLGALAFLRNLRNMEQAGVSQKVIKEGLGKLDVSRVLPFRFISAAKYAPGLEPELEALMFSAVESMEKLPGKTALLVDNSGSMYSPISAKSDLHRVDAAAALAILLREICDEVDVISFSDRPTLIPARRGFALAEAVKRAPSGGTNTNSAKVFADARGYDRIIILTDEQSHQALSNPKSDLAYVINVASYQNGVGYGKWTHVDGWSEGIVSYIQALEGLESEGE